MRLTYPEPTKAIEQQTDMDLFRRQALDARRSSLLGTVDLTSSAMGWPLGLLAAALIATLIGFLVLGSVSRSEPARGQLLPSGGLLPVIAPRSGTLVRVLVKEGAAVKAGQPLFEISAERSSQALPVTGLGGTLKGELEKQRRLLESDLIWVNSAEIAHEDKMREQAEYLGRQLELLEQQYALKQQQAQSAKSLLARIRKLDSGMLTALQMQQYESAALIAESEVKRLQQQLMEAQRDHAKALRQLHSAPVDLIGQRNTIERSLSDVAQSLARNATDTAQQVLAPRDGVISVLSVHPGQPVKEGMRVLALVPKDAVLEAELWVPSRAVGPLAPGGRVAMRYDAFPYQQFGHRYGRITRISDSALMPEEVYALSGINVLAPSYRITVALDEQRPLHAGRHLRLRPNMGVDADLLLERQRLYRLALPAAANATNVVQN